MFYNITLTNAIKPHRLEQIRGVYSGNGLLKTAEGKRFARFCSEKIDLKETLCSSYPIVEKVIL